MRHHASTPSALVLTLLLAAPAVAGDVEVYRWKDANGKYHFSDRRPERGDADKLSVDAPAHKPNPELEQFRQKTRAKLAALDAERQQAERESRTRQIIAARQERNCTELRNAMRAEEQVAVLYTFDDKGEIQHLSDEQRINYKNELQTQWQSYCNGR